MRSIIFIFLILVTIVTELSSQANYPPSVGLNLAMKAGVSVVQTPVGRQNALSFNKLPDIGLSGYYPISENAPLGVVANIDFCNYSYIIKDYGNGNLYKNSNSYISFAPSLFFKGIMLGFGFGIPLSADVDGSSIDEGTINTLYDLRFGYSYDLYLDESARLSIYIIASYMLNHIFSDFETNDPMKLIVPQVENYIINNSHNPRAASLSIGISYYYLGSGKSTE